MKQIYAQFIDDSITHYGRVKLLLVTRDDNGNIAATQNHSMSIEPGDDLAAVRASLEAHLAQDFAASNIPGAPWPAIPDEEWAKVTASVPIYHPEPVVEAYQAEAEAKRQEAQAQAAAAARQQAERDAAAQAEFDARVAAAMERQQAQQ